MNGNPFIGLIFNDLDTVEYIRRQQKKAAGSGGITPALYQIIYVAVHKKIDFVKIMAVQIVPVGGVLGLIIAEADTICLHGQIGGHCPAPYKSLFWGYSQHNPESLYLQ